MLENMTIRNAVVADVPAILRIYEPYVRETAVTFEWEPPTEEDFAQRVAKTLERYPYLVAECEGRVVGYAYAGPFKGRAAYDWSAELSVYIDRGYRRAGVGRALYTALEQELRDRGLVNLYACIAYPEVEDEYLTFGSVRFHERLGYERVATFEKCASKFGRWYGIVWMGKTVNDHAPNPVPVAWRGPSAMMRSKNEEPLHEEGCRMETAAIVLAAGAGTRMKSDLPKVAHEVLGKPLVVWVLDAAEEAGVDRVVTVVGHAREQVIPLVEGRSEIVVQEEQKGTAHAVLSCAKALEGFDGSVLVLSGDCPLISSSTMRALIEKREANDAAVVVLTMRMPDPFGYGRIIRDANGEVERIVEQKDASAEEAAVNECNSGFYCFDAHALFEALEQVGSDNAQGEFYLTDVLEISRKAGRAVLALPADDATECMGINTREQLAEVEGIARARSDA